MPRARRTVFYPVKPSFTALAVNWSCNASRLCGTTRTSPTTAMYFVSPLQRGTTWVCRWPGTPAQIGADIEPLRMQRVLQQANRITRYPRHLHEIIFADGLQFTDMLARGNQQMSVGVGKPVHDHEDPVAAPDDVVLPIVFRFVPVAADKAAVICLARRQ